MTNWNERNHGVIQEFRASGGRAAGRELLLLTTKGSRSGKSHTTPLMYLKDGDIIAVFGSKGGAPDHPDWYKNLVANPEVRVEVDGEDFETRAELAGPEERDRLYGMQAERHPMFGDYQKRAGRTIPVVILRRPAK